MILERALSYAHELSFAVFPVHGIFNGVCTCGNPDCANAGKHPVPINGLKAATKDEDAIRRLFSSSRPYNIGIATGPISNIFVVDVDGAEGEESIADLQSANSPLPKTLTSLTGRGRHLIFRHPGIKIKTRSSKLGNKLDIRGDGGYIVAPPSNHKSGAVYQWSETQGYEIADAPEWLIKLVMAEVAPDTAPIPTTPTDNEWSNEDVEDMLSFIDPDVFYDEWVSIGMALQDGGFSFAMFNNWSAKGSKYKGQKDCDFHWKSFNPGSGITMGTLVSFAMTQGWKPSFQQDDTLMFNGRQSAYNILETISSQAAPIQLDFNTIPGIIGDTVKWILSNAQKPQPELALINTLAALGAVFGRRYRSPLDTRTNIYMVGLAGTAAGKNHSKKSIKSLMMEAGLTDFLGGESIVSGAGLLSDISKQPSQIMHLDEFGMLLEAIMDKRGASHMKMASKIITELYSCSSEKYIGGQYADKKVERTVIANPNLCIFGISTLEKYTSSLNRDAIASGELNRFIVYRASEDNPKRRRGISHNAPPEWLVNAWKSFKPNTINNGMVELETALVEWPLLQDRIDDMGDFEDEQIARNLNQAGALWGRYRENAIKVAMIIAIARNPLKAQITAADLDFAEALVRQSVDFMVSMVAEHLADSQHEKDCKEIVQMIKRKEGRVSRTELCRMTQRMDSKQREAAILSLLNQEKISIDSYKSGLGSGRPKIWYVLIK